MSDKDVKQNVREAYGGLAKQKRPNCCSTTDLCCQDVITPESLAAGLGYSTAELESLPEGANMGLGCGNPTAFASLKEGETVVDLGSGGGIDCFLAASRVGKTGKVIGIDMTPAMIEKANANAASGDYDNVQFRLGEIEQLPVEDNEADCVISNCVINLSPDKLQVFSEAFRILKPGGRLMVSDIVLTQKLPESIQSSISAYVGCIAGAVLKGDYISSMVEAGFKNIEIIDESRYFGENGADSSVIEKCAEIFQVEADVLKKVASNVLSIKVSAIKPAQ